MGKLDGKVAVITGGSAGLALAGARLFADEGAHVFITGRRQDALDEAVKLIGRNVTAVRGDAADLDDLDRLYDTVRREKERWAAPRRSRRSRSSSPRTTRATSTAWSWSPMAAPRRSERGTTENESTGDEDTRKQSHSAPGKRAHS